MDASEISKRVLLGAGVRLEPWMVKYLERALRLRGTAAGDAIPVIGGQARTGVPIRTMVPLELFTQPPPPAEPT